MKTSTLTAKAGTFIRLFRTLNSEMPMQQADVLLTIARSPGITMAELADELQLAQSSTSRNVQALSRFVKLGQPGLDLIEYQTDPRDTRRRLFFLTTKGKAFVTKLLRQFEAGFSLDQDTDARVLIEEMHEQAGQPAKPAGRKNRREGITL